MNSRDKGKRGEREFAALLREHGFDARRGQQFAGGGDSPDVVSEALDWIHFEVKRTQALNLRDACAQAEGDCAGRPWVVAHRRNHAPWLMTMRAEFFFELIQPFEPRRRGGAEGTSQEETEGTENGQPDDRQDACPTLGIMPEAWAWIGKAGEKVSGCESGGPRARTECPPHQR